MSSLATLQQCRRQLETDSTGSLAAEQDPILADYIASASNAIEDLTGYYFGPKYQLIGFNGDVGYQFPQVQLQQWPLVQADLVTNGDGSVIASTSYSLLPVGRWPKEQLRLAQGTYFTTPGQICSPVFYDGIYAYPPSYAYAEDAIQITGYWVYHRRWPTAWTLAYNGATQITLGATVNASAKQITLSSSAGLSMDVGSELRIDTELFRVTGPIASSTVAGFATTTVDVERDYDNYADTSRATAHTIGAAIYVWQPETEITHCCAMAVAAFYKQRDNATGDQQIVSGGGFGTATVITPQDLPSRVKGLLQPYRSYWRGRTQ